MKITWLGHAGFRIEIGDQVLLVDPWVTGNPVFPEERRGEAIAGATHILLSHGHFDHVNDTARHREGARHPGGRAWYDLASWLGEGATGIKKASASTPAALSRWAMSM
jgi:L-ascorbate metabolism protein UlaG (beta-lactamase superfamily)